MADWHLCRISSIIKPYENKIIQTRVFTGSMVVNRPEVTFWLKGDETLMQIQTFE